MVLFENEYFVIAQYGLSAFHYAFSRGYEKTWQLLLNKIGLLDVKNGVSFNVYPFYTACGCLISCFNCRIIGELWI